jgi:hypothetical protein
MQLRLEGLVPELQLFSAVNFNNCDCRDKSTFEPVLLKVCFCVYKLRNNLCNPSGGLLVLKRV